jgi:DNA-binding SARP family transcriptional activator
MGTTSDDAAEWRLRLLGSWELGRRGRPVHLRHRQRRLVAALALHEPVHRESMATMLWPDSPRANAGINLRTTLHQLHGAAAGLIESDGYELRLGERVTVDVADLCGCRRADAASGLFSSAARALLMTGELLPGWYDEWLDEPRAHLERHRISALEGASAVELDRGHIEEAIDLAETAVAADPLRESAHYLVVRGHLAAGNRARAILAYRRLRDILRAELDVRPSRAFPEVSAQGESSADAGQRHADGGIVAWQDRDARRGELIA